MLVICAVVRVDEILQHVDVTPSTFEREIFVRFRFERATKSFYVYHFYVVIFRSVEMDAATP